MNVELLAPAGSFEGLKTALCFGADAVYCGGPMLQLRAGSSSFSFDGLKKAVDYTHSLGKKLYVTVNCFANNDEIPLVGAYGAGLLEIGVDAVIVSDLGVLAELREKCPSLEVHISTQANTQNYKTIEMWHSLGAKRVVLGREMTMTEIERLKGNIPSDCEIEVFVHGAMCMAYSGRCLLSSFMNNRSGNRGQCSQPCRWNYYLVEEKRQNMFIPVIEEAGATAVLSSTDLKSISFLDRLADAGVTSFKIEGRMKSSYYAAVVTNAYRHAIDAAVAGAPLDPLWVEEVNKVSHRPYTTGFYFGDPGQYYHDATYFTDADVAAVVETCDADGNAVLCQRNKFYRGDELELLTTDAAPVKFTVEHMYNSEGEEIDDTRHAMMAIHMRLPRYAERYSIVRKCR